MSKGKKDQNSISEKISKFSWQEAIMFLKEGTNFQRLLDEKPESILHCAEVPIPLLVFAVHTCNYNNIKAVFDKYKKKPEFIDSINIRDDKGSNLLGIVFLGKAALGENFLKTVELFISTKAFDVNAYLNNKLGMDCLLEKNHLLSTIGGFNILHITVKNGIEDLGLSIKILKLLEKRNISFGVDTPYAVKTDYPAQNPLHHMTSPIKILENRQKKLEDEIKTLEEKKYKKSEGAWVTKTKQKLSEHQNALKKLKNIEETLTKLIEMEHYGSDSSGDSDNEDSNAYQWKQKLQALISDENKPSVGSQDRQSTQIEVMPLFHGMPLMANLYNSQERADIAKKLIGLNLEEQADIIKGIYSRTLTANMQIENLFTMVNYNDKSLLKKQLNAFLKNLSSTQLNDQVLDFVNRYQDTNGTVQKEVWVALSQNRTLLGNVVKYRFPFISTSKTPDHAISYGFGINLEEDKRGEDSVKPFYGYDELRPMKPKHRLAGLIYVIIEKPKQQQLDLANTIGQLIKNQEIFDICTLKSSKGTGVKSHFGYQVEIAYLAGIDSQKVVVVIPLIYPNFSKDFNAGYHEKVYSLTSEQYGQIKRTLLENQSINYWLKYIFTHYVDKVVKKICEGCNFKPYMLLPSSDIQLVEYNVSTNYHYHSGRSGNHKKLIDYRKDNKNPRPENVSSNNDEENGSSALFDHPDSTSWHKYWYKYTKTAMNELLKLRLGFTEVSKELKVINPSYKFDGTMQGAKLIAQEIANKIVDGTSLVILNLYGKHWVGMAVDKNADTIKVTYMDSERTPMPEILKQQLVQELTLSNPEQVVNITEAQLEEQKYNNCGSEVIENFVAYATGDRANQDDAIELHSRLFEDSIMLAGIAD